MIAIGHVFVHIDELQEQHAEKCQHAESQQAEDFMALCNTSRLLLGTAGRLSLLVINQRLLHVHVSLDQIHVLFDMRTKHVLTLFMHALWLYVCDLADF